MDIPHRARGATTSLALLATLASGFTLFALARILTPLALAVFLLISIGGLARTLTGRVGVPKWASLAASIGVVVALFALAIWLISSNAAQIARDSGPYVDRLNALLQAGAARLGVHEVPTINGLVHQLNPARYTGVIAAGVGHLLESAVFVLVYLGFLLASRRNFEGKLRRAYTDPAREGEALRIVDRVRRGVESYIWVQTVVGLIIAGASALLMWSVGLSNVLFWTFLIFLSNYIPAIGAAIGVLLPALFGLVNLDSAWVSVALVVGLEAIHFTVSHVVQPRMQGKSLNLDPIVVLLALAFWGLLWGLPGAFLSTPLTVMAMAILVEFPATRGIAVLLSADGRPYASETTTAAI